MVETARAITEAFTQFPPRTPWEMRAKALAKAADVDWEELAMASTEDAPGLMSASEHYLLPFVHLADECRRTLKR